MSRRKINFKPRVTFTIARPKSKIYEQLENDPVAEELRKKQKAERARKRRVARFNKQLERDSYGEASDAKSTSLYARAAINQANIDSESNRGKVKIRSEIRDDLNQTQQFDSLKQVFGYRPDKSVSNSPDGMRSSSSLEEDSEVKIQTGQ